MIFVGVVREDVDESTAICRPPTPTAAPTVVVPRAAGHEYDVDHYDGDFYITTNRGAKNFQVVTAPMADPSETNWQVFIAHNPAVKIEALSFFRRHLVVSERERGLNYLRVIRHADEQTVGRRTGSPPTSRTTRCRSAPIRSSTPRRSASATSRW